MDNARAPRTAGLRRLILAGGAAVIVAASAVGVGAYSYLKPTAPESAPITVVPITTMNANDSSAVDPNGSTLYAIESGASEATFTIDEVLNGSPKTVVGTTDQVSGQAAFDPFDPSSLQIGTILIDARTLQTDDSSRTRVLNNQILSTGQYEYISLTPTSVSGLPDSVSVGQPFTFQLTGDLTIRDTTQPATFDVTATLNPDGTLHGTATSTIQYADWGVSIPSVPFVASVGDQVVLGLDFNVTTAQG
ncbi:MAG: YceI family protein [Chloroflexi bacterium]|nr:YceI family protein [Chloroflexota bacterium]